MRGKNAFLDQNNHVRGTAEIKPLEGELRLTLQILVYKGQKA